MDSIHEGKETKSESGSSSRRCGVGIRSGDYVSSKKKKKERETFTRDEKKEESKESKSAESESGREETKYNRKRRVSDESDMALVGTKRPCWIAYEVRVAWEGLRPADSLFYIQSADLLPLIVFLVHCGKLTVDIGENKSRRHHRIVDAMIDPYMKKGGLIVRMTCDTNEANVCGENILHPTLREAKWLHADRLLHGTCAWTPHAEALAQGIYEKLRPHSHPKAEERGRAFAQFALDCKLDASQYVLLLDGPGRNLYACLDKGVPASQILLAEMRPTTALYHLFLRLLLRKPFHTLYTPDGVEQEIITGRLPSLAGVEKKAKVSAVYFDFMGEFSDSLDTCMDILTCKFSTRVIGLTQGKRNCWKTFPLQKRGYVCLNKWNQSRARCWFFTSSPSLLPVVSIRRPYRMVYHDSDGMQIADYKTFDQAKTAFDAYDWKIACVLVRDGRCLLAYGHREEFLLDALFPIHCNITDEDIPEQSNSFFHLSPLQ